MKLHSTLGFLTLLIAPTMALAAHYEPTASLTDLANYGLTSPTVAYAQVTDGGPYIWITSSACATPDGLYFIQANPDIPGSCWALNTQRVLGPPLTTGASSPTVILPTGATNANWGMWSQYTSPNDTSRWGYNQSSVFYTPTVSSEPMSWIGLEANYPNPSYPGTPPMMEIYLRFEGIGNTGGVFGPTGYAEPFYTNFDRSTNLVRDTFIRGEGVHIQDTYNTTGDRFTIDGGSVTSNLPLYVNSAELHVNNASPSTSGSRVLFDSDGNAELQFRDGLGNAKWEIGVNGAAGSYGWFVYNVNLAKYVLYSDQATGNFGFGTTAPNTAYDFAGTVAPHTDNTYGFGSASQRWANIYAVNLVDSTESIGGCTLGINVLCGTGPVSFNGGNPTGVTSQASQLNVLPGTVTITGAFSSQAYTRFQKPTLSAASALNVTNLDNVRIFGPPTLSGSATGTNVTGLRVTTSAVGAGAVTAVAGWFDAPSGAAANYALWTVGGVVMRTLPTDLGQTDNTLCVQTSTGIVYTGTGTLGTCLGTSSRRYKNDIQPVTTEAVPLIMKLTPSSYRYKPGHGDAGTKRDYWLIAEDLQKVLPQCVGKDNQGKPASADPICVQTFMIKAMQEQQREHNAEISELNSRIASLERRLQR